MVVIKEEDYIAHYGTPRRSGRYPWGSGGNADDTPSRNQDFLGMYNELRGQGLSDTQIAEGLGMKTTELRDRRAVDTMRKKQHEIDEAVKLRDKGMGPSAIGRQMGVPESTVRTLLRDSEKMDQNILITTSDMLRRQVEDKPYLDIGAGVENHLGISKEKLRQAVLILKDEGYSVNTFDVSQVTMPEQKTTFKVLSPPGTTQNQAWTNREKIQQISEWSTDHGETTVAIQKPMSISSKRVGVVYGEKGGQQDGVMYIRDNVSDVSLGKAPYAQVRVLVDGTHYLKGMAMYNDDMPPGIDILFHTAKEDTGKKLDALKPVEKDPKHPFGSNISHQILDDKQNLTSSMNIVNDDANWDKWAKSVSSQMLSKQSPELARKQLKLKQDERLAEYAEIKSLTNPTVRKKLLETFAESTDHSAAHLEAATMPGQAWHAILPINSLPPGQIYAPGYENGQRVALIRYPHGGTFEIPELTVNNRNPQARKYIGEAKHAVGIHHTVAERLSGADFDGDTVLVIPNDRGKIKISPALEGLKNFNPKKAYPYYEGMKVMDAKTMQQEMGKISNLITDMTILGAPSSDISKAVKHSMVVIDAKKHKLDYKRSEQDNGIIALKKEYQGGGNRGASTIISRANSELRVNDRRPRRASEGGPVNLQTGAKEWVYTDKPRTTRNGKVVPATIKTTKLAEAIDATSLASTKNTRMELVYAKHSNDLKALANKARLDAVNTPPLKQSASAKKVYSKEVASLNSKLDLVDRNKPLERQAQIVATATVRMQRQANPQMEDDAKKKLNNQAITEARVRTGAHRYQVKFSDKEWEAIQAGAISNSMLTDLLNKSDMDHVRQLATPRTKKLMTSAKTKRAQSLLDNGYTRSEVAKLLGVSLTTLDVATSGGG